MLGASEEQTGSTGSYKVPADSASWVVVKVSAICQSGREATLSNDRTYLEGMTPDAWSKINCRGQGRSKWPVKRLL